MEIDNLTRAISRAAAQLRSRPTSDEIFEGIVKGAMDALPKFGHVGLSTIRDGSATVLHASTIWVEKLDAAQHDLGEGPAVDAVRDDVTVVAGPMRHDQRWPSYVRLAVEQGVRAQIAMRMFLDESDVTAAMNLYSTAVDGVTTDDVMVAETYAAHASVLLNKAWQADQFDDAIASRQTIGVAIGLLMGQYGLDECQAKSFLWRTSSTTNVKVREVATLIVDRANVDAGTTDR